MSSAAEALRKLDATLAKLAREHAEGRVGNTPVKAQRGGVK